MGNNQLTKASLFIVLAVFFVSNLVVIVLIYFLWK